MTLSGLSRSAAGESAWGSSHGAGGTEEGNTRRIYCAAISTNRSPPRFPGDFAKNLCRTLRSRPRCVTLGNRAPVSRENSNHSATEGSDVTGTLAGPTRVQFESRTWIGKCSRPRENGATESTARRRSWKENFRIERERRTAVAGELYRSARRVVRGGRRIGGRRGNEDPSFFGGPLSGEIRGIGNSRRGVISRNRELAERCNFAELPIREV